MILDPSAKSSEPVTIDPVLQSALGSLDVRLEDELARYRRLRPGKPRLNHRLSSQGLQPLELFEAGRTPVVSPADVETSIPEVSQSSEPPIVQEQSIVSSLVHQPAKSENGFAENHTQPHRDYLESSEQLLRSLEKDTQKEKIDTKAANSLLTPLGVGSMLVLLVSSALLGSALIAPESFSHLKLGSFKFDNRPSSSSEVETELEVGETSQEGVVQTPNLTNSEFVELNLESLSTLPLDSSPATLSSQSALVQVPEASPTESSSSGLPSSSSNLTSALLPPALRPQPLEPVEPEGQVQATTATTAEEVNPAPAPTNRDFYFVMVDYTGASSLATAQSLVGDAYLVKLPQGVRIQMAATPIEARAKEFAEELQKQGLVASIYRPQ